MRSRGTMIRLVSPLLPLLVLLYYSLVQIQLHRVLLDNDDSAHDITTGAFGREGNRASDAERQQRVLAQHHHATAAGGPPHRKQEEIETIQQHRTSPAAAGSGSAKIVDTGTWARPPPEYTIDLEDLWEEQNTAEPQLPTWMMNYFRWHKEQTAAVERSATHHHPRYLYVTCLAEYRKCGGTADRLLSLPFLVKVAAMSRRILLIQWTRPAALEEFLLPPAHGIDWRVPDGQDTVLQKNSERAGDQDSILAMAARSDVAVLQVKFQSHDHGAVYYDSHRESVDEPDFAALFHRVWRIFFTPAPALAARIQTTLRAGGLVPGRYGAAHVRALYGVEEREEELITGWTQNAIHCAIQLLQQQENVSVNDDPVFFASDSELATRKAVQYGQANGLKVISRRSLTNSSSVNKDPLHMDKTKDWRNRPASDFYDVFIDLYSMGLSRCVTYGMGGYGQFASLISGASRCSLAHMNATAMAQCQSFPDRKSFLRRQALVPKERSPAEDDHSQTSIFLQPMQPRAKLLLHL